jgi:glucan phosphorylase
VNGVASMHTKILKEEVFVDFYKVCDSSQRLCVTDAQ